MHTCVHTHIRACVLGCERSLVNTRMQHTHACRYSQRYLNKHTHTYKQYTEHTHAYTQTYIHMHLPNTHRRCTLSK